MQSVNQGQSMALIGIHSTEPAPQLMNVSAIPLTLQHTNIPPTEEQAHGEKNHTH